MFRNSNFYKLHKIERLSTRVFNVNRRPLLFITHLYVFSMITSYIRTHIFHIIFSPSLLNQLLWKHLIEPLIPPTYSSCFNSQFLGCFMLFSCFTRLWSFTPHFHISRPLNRVSCSPLKSLGSSLISSALARQMVVHGRAFFRFFVSKYFSRASMVVRSK